MKELRKEKEKLAILNDIENIVKDLKMILQKKD